MESDRYQHFAWKDVYVLVDARFGDHCGEVSWFIVEVFWFSICVKNWNWGVRRFSVSRLQFNTKKLDCKRIRCPEWPANGNWSNPAQFWRATIQEIAQSEHFQTNYCTLFLLKQTLRQALLSDKRNAKIDYFVFVSVAGTASSVHGRNFHEETSLKLLLSSSRNCESQFSSGLTIELPWSILDFFQRS